MNPVTISVDLIRLALGLDLSAIVAAFCRLMPFC